MITGTSVSSGDAQMDIADGKLRPTVWSPASSMWGRTLTFESDSGYVPDENPSIVRTPLVIAMWEPMARALGWPRREIGFSDVLRLARAARGWEQFGHPEFGDFKLVHTNPDYSTSGLSGVVAEYYSATSKKEGLTVADIDKARATVTDMRHPSCTTRHDPLRRRAAQKRRPGLRLGGLHGGGHARGLQPETRLPGQARGHLSV